MDETRLEERRAFKKLQSQYRHAAGRLHNTKVSEVAHVQQTDEGAFVEIVVWVPKEEVEKEE